MKAGPTLSSLATLLPDGRWALVWFLVFMQTLRARGAEPVLVSFDWTAATVSEAGRSTGFNVMLDRVADVPVTVEWQVAGGTAIAGVDFAPTNGTLTFNPGSVVASFPLRVSDDTLTQGNRTVDLRLLTPSSPAALGTQRNATLTITDNDEPGFAGDAVNGRILSLTPMGPDRVAAVGPFLSIHGEARPGFAVLRRDARLADMPPIWFDSTNPNPELTAIASCADGGVFLGGSFREVNGHSRKFLVRLRADGSVDEQFDPDEALPSPPVALAESPLGGVVAVGSHDRFNGTTGQGNQFRRLGCIARLDAHGQKDFNFVTRASPATGGNIPVLGTAVDRHIVMLPDGRFYVSEIDVYRDPLGSSANNPVLRKQLARFQPDGALDDQFAVSFPGTGPIQPRLTGLLMDTDARLLVTGSFTKVADQPRPGLARLLHDGSLDQTFEPAFTSSSVRVVYSVIRLADGRLEVVVHQPEARSALLRLSASGALESAPASILLDGFFGGSSIDTRPAVALADGTVFMAGPFKTVNGLHRQGLAYFHPDGALATDRPVALTKPEIGTAGRLSARIDARFTGRVLVEGSENLMSWEPLSERDVTPGLETVELSDTVTGQGRFFRARRAP